MKMQVKIYIFLIVFSVRTSNGKEQNEFCQRKEFAYINQNSSFYTICYPYFKGTGCLYVSLVN